MENKKLFMDRRGMTLIEVLIALFLLTIAIAGLVGSFNKASSYNRLCNNRYMASQLAAEKMEEMSQVESYADITTTDSGGSDSVDLSGLAGSRTWSVSGPIDDAADGVAPADTDPDDYRSITVTVSWTGEGRSLQETLITYRTKPLI